MHDFFFWKEPTKNIWQFQNKHPLLTWYFFDTTKVTHISHISL